MTGNTPIKQHAGQSGLRRGPGRPRKQSTLLAGQTKLPSSYITSNTPDTLASSSIDHAQEITESDEETTVNPAPAGNQANADIGDDEDYIQGYSSIDYVLPDYLAVNEEDMLEDEFGGEDLATAIDDINAAEIENDPECPKDSVIEAYVKNHIKRTMKKGQPPQEYAMGTYWHYPKMPSFALDQEADATPLYYPPIFLWFPHHRVSIKSLCCPECKSSIEIKEINRPRCVIDVSKLRHATLELQYLDAVKHRQSTQPTIATAFRSSSQATKYPEFSEFNDKNKYPGYIPSKKYLRGIYTAIIATVRPYIQRLVKLTGGEVLKGDHSFKILKNMGAMNDQPTFSAMYTVVNEYGEIRLLQLTPTKALSHLGPQFDAMMASYHEFGHPPVKAFFTDNVKGDKNFLVSHIPSLLDGVQDVQATPPTNVGNLDVLEIPDDIWDRLAVADAPEVINRLCNTLLEESVNKNGITIGLDCEWRFNETTKQSGKVAVIQIAWAANIYIFQVFRCRSLPTSLAAVLKSTSIKKAGKQVNSDLARIAKDYGVDCAPPKDKSGKTKPGFNYELGQFCRERDVIHNGKLGLDRICEAALSRRLPKGPVRLSNWEAKKLSEAQVKYAALDVWASLKIYQAVAGLPLMNQPVTSITPPGTCVGFCPGSTFKTIAAYGIIVEDQPEYYEGIPVSGEGNILVEFSKVNMPAAILEAHVLPQGQSRTPSPPRTLQSLGDTPCRGVVHMSQLRTAKKSSLNTQSQQPGTVGDNNQSEVNETVEFQNADITEQDNDSPEIATELVLGVDQETLDYGQNLFESVLKKRRSTLVNENTENQVHSRVLRDIFHVIDYVDVSLKHGLAKEFKRRFRDAMFVVDSDDRTRVEAFLQDKGGRSWNEEADRNPDWVFSRVKRVVPPPSELLPKVHRLFQTLGPLKCAKTGQALFNRLNWKQAASVLESIQAGHVSDPPGLSLYFHIRTDKNNLPIYKCFRGTNSVEGGVHQNIMRSFTSFNASVQLTDAIIVYYVLHHNLNVGTMNRYGKPYSGHYLPWITQSINRLRVEVGHPLLITQEDPHGNTLCFEGSTEESFGICRLPDSWIEYFGMEKNNKEVEVKHSASETIEHAAQISAHLAISLTKQTDNQYEYLAQKQGTKYAIVPIHTKEEVSLFKGFLENDKRFRDTKPNWDLLAQEWSKKANGINIFYKTPEHLQGYDNVRMDRSKYTNTISINFEVCRGIQEDLQSQSRKRYVEPSIDPTPSKVPRLQQAATAEVSSLTAGSSLVVTSHQMESQAQPPTQPHFIHPLRFESATVLPVIVPSSLPSQQSPTEQSPYSVQHIIAPQQTMARESAQFVLAIPVKVDLGRNGAKTSNASPQNAFTATKEPAKVYISRIDATSVQKDAQAVTKGNAVADYGQDSANKDCHRT
ncbi:hypothetical protein BJV82DRAFT_675472 [Fennellomyces sp. T-0311]|nr:hypothetical protein BJV82DRAFT_675472 [Fennellomyces sp. T-0311]